MDGFQIRWPRGYKPPPGWRTRAHAIETALNEPDSQLRQRLQEADRLACEDGEVAARLSLQLVLDDDPNLFWGEAGRRLLWAIFCDAEPFLWERDRRQPSRLPNGDPSPFDDYYRRRNVFEDPAPPRYRPQKKEPGRKKAYAARSTPQERGDVRAGIVNAGPDFERVRVMLGGDIARRIPPLNYPDMARKLRITTTELHKELHRLKHRIGLTWIRKAKDQEEYARVIGELIWAANEAEQRESPDEG
jgi:hypothetical protein